MITKYEFDYIFKNEVHTFIGTQKEFDNNMNRLLNRGYYVKVLYRKRLGIYM